MQCEHTATQSADYLAGTLGENELQQFENHLQSCQRCRAELEALSQIWTKLHDIPALQPNSRAMRARFEILLRQKESSHKGLRAFAAERPTRWWRLRMAAALLAVGLATVAMTTWLMSRGSTPRGMSDVAGMSDTAQYLKERPALMHSLNTQLAALPPTTREKVLADLQTIDRSIRDVQTAIGRDPGNTLLRTLLLDTYQDEERLLLTVQEAANWTQHADTGRRKS